MNIPLLLIGLCGAALRSSEQQKDVDLGNILFAGTVVATVTTLAKRND